MSEGSPVYALYVEKELVGKRVKSTKVKVTWKFACGPDLKTQEVQLKHSLISGKREISLNGNIIFTSKKSFDKSHPFKHSFTVLDTAVTAFIEDGVDGFIYDLLLNDKPFHRTTRISVYDLEQLRKRKNSDKRDSLHTIDYKEFVQSGAMSEDKNEENTASHGPAEIKQRQQDQVPEENLLESYNPSLYSSFNASTSKRESSEFGGSDWTAFASPDKDWDGMNNQNESNPFIESQPLVGSRTHGNQDLSTIDFSSTATPLHDPFAYSIDSLQQKHSYPVSEVAYSEAVTNQLQTLNLGSKLQQNSGNSSNLGSNVSYGINPISMQESQPQSVTQLENPSSMNNDPFNGLVNLDNLSGSTPVSTTRHQDFTNGYLNESISSNPYHATGTSSSRSLNVGNANSQHYMPTQQLNMMYQTNATQQQPTWNKKDNNPFL